MQKLEADRETAKVIEQLMALSISDPEAFGKIAEGCKSETTSENTQTGIDEQKRERIWKLCYQILRKNDILAQKELIRQYIEYLQKKGDEPMKLDS